MIISLIEKKKMPDKIFIDTNLWIYLHSDDTSKKQLIHTLLEKQFENIVISVQILNECFNSLTRKKITSFIEAKNIVENIADSYMVLPLILETTKQAIAIQARYQFSYYDSLVVATALQAECKILYTEDLQHGQIIEKQLTIINPFL